MCLRINLEILMKRRSQIKIFSTRPVMIVMEQKDLTLAPRKMMKETKTGLTMESKTKSTLRSLNYRIELSFSDTDASLRLVIIFMSEHMNSSKRAIQTVPLPMKTGLASSRS